MGDKPSIAPLTEKQVKASAEKLEKLSLDFLQGDQEKAFSAWHKELCEISRHGISSTRDVFKQVEKDKKSVVPSTEKVFLPQDGAGIAEMIIQPSTAGRFLGKKEYIGSVVNSETVLSSALGKKNARFADLKMQDNVGMNPFDRVYRVDFDALLKKK